MTAAQWTALFTGIGVSAVLAFIAKATNWMSMVSDNHLQHIQKSSEATAKGVTELKEAIVIHNEREQGHHELQVQMIRLIGSK